MFSWHLNQIIEEEQSDLLALVSVQNAASVDDNNIDGLDELAMACDQVILGINFKSNNEFRMGRKNKHTGMDSMS
jgi:hypothetical protein